MILLGDSWSYERLALEQWFKDGNTTSPVNGTTVEVRVMMSNITLKRAIAQWKEQLQRQQGESQMMDAGFVPLLFLLCLHSSNARASPEFDMLKQQNDTMPHVCMLP